MSDEYREDLRRRLQSVFTALSETALLSTIFDRCWCEEIQRHIDEADLTGDFRCDSAFMFFQLDHWFRGEPWYEEAQRLLEQGRVDELDSDQRFVLGWFPPDPLKVFLPILDQRLLGFSQLPFKTAEVSRRLQELRANRFKADFAEHAFELSVLGFFALKGVLTDIGVPVGNEYSTVDGEINLDGRPILVEATLTTQGLLPTEPGAYAVDIESLVKQVVRKITKKVADGRQLALARGVPSVLFLGRYFLGADEITARWGIKECFANTDFAKLSAIIVSDSWKLLTTELHVASKAEIPLSGAEAQALTEWFNNARIGRQLIV